MEYSISRANIFCGVVELYSIMLELQISMPFLCNLNALEKLYAECFAKEKQSHTKHDYLRYYFASWHWL
jgi:hypothetical protein